MGKQVHRLSFVLAIFFAFAVARAQDGGGAATTSAPTAAPIPAISGSVPSMVGLMGNMANQTFEDVAKDRAECERLIKIAIDTCQAGQKLATEKCDHKDLNEAVRRKKTEALDQLKPGGSGYMACKQIIKSNEFIPEQLDSYIKICTEGRERDCLPKCEDAKKNITGYINAKPNCAGMLPKALKPIDRRIGYCKGLENRVRKAEQMKQDVANENAGAQSICDKAGGDDASVEEGKKTALDDEHDPDLDKDDLNEKVRARMASAGFACDNNAENCKYDQQAAYKQTIQDTYGAGSDMSKVLGGESPTTSSSETYGTTQYWSEFAEQQRQQQITFNQLAGGYTNPRPATAPAASPAPASATPTSVPSAAPASAAEANPAGLTPQQQQQLAQQAQAAAAGTNPGDSQASQLAPVPSGQQLPALSSLPVAQTGVPTVPGVPPVAIVGAGTDGTGGAPTTDPAASAATSNGEKIALDPGPLPALPSTAGDDPVPAARAVASGGPVGGRAGSPRSARATDSPASPGPDRTTIASANVLSGSGGSGGGGASAAARPWWKPSFVGSMFGFGDSSEPTATAVPKDTNVDLSRFLPNGKPVGLAGAAGTRDAAMHGPHTVLWNAMRGRYHSLAPTLIQPDDAR